MIIVRHYQNNSNEKKSRFHYSLHVRNKIISMYECPIIRQTVLAPKLIGSKYHINYNIITFINTYKCQWITHAFTLTTNFKKLSRVSRSNPDRITPRNPREFFSILRTYRMTVACYPHAAMSLFFDSKKT